MEVLLYFERKLWVLFAVLFRGLPSPLKHSFAPGESSPNLEAKEKPSLVKRELITTLQDNFVELAIAITHNAENI